MALECLLQSPQKKAEEIPGGEQVEPNFPTEKSSFPGELETGRHPQKSWFPLLSNAILTMVGLLGYNLSLDLQ